MFKIFAISCILVTSIYAKLNILYWNFETDLDFNKNSLDFEFMRDAFNSNEFDIIILNNVVSPNLPPRFSVPYQVFNSGDTFISEKERSYHVVMRSYSSSEDIEIKKYIYPDKHKKFFKNTISGFIINNKAIIVLNFNEKNNDKNINNILNLNHVINDIKSRLKIDEKNILFVGNIDIKKDIIHEKIPNFRNILSEDGSKIEFVRERGFTGYKLVEHDLFFSSNKSVTASPYIKFKETLLNGKYKGKENTKSYMERVSEYLPIHLIFHP